MDSLWKELCDECPEIKDETDQQITGKKEELDFTKDIKGNYGGSGPQVDICIAYSTINGPGLAR